MQELGSRRDRVVIDVRLGRRRPGNRVGQGPLGHRGLPQTPPHRTQPLRLAFVLIDSAATSTPLDFSTQEMHRRRQRLAVCPGARNQVSVHSFQALGVLDRSSTDVSMDLCRRLAFLSGSSLLGANGT
jgi:hypothetical protein